MHIHSPVILGTGQLGLAIMDELAARGASETRDTAVTLVNRSGRAPEPLPAGVRVVAGDVTRPEVVAALCAGADVVFHCAQPAYTEWPTHFPPITRGILEGVAQTGARLVFGDNLYMYGRSTTPLHEDLPHAATGPKGRTRALMARELLAAHAAGRLRVAIGRASDFYGPRVTGSALGDRFFAAALAGKTADLLGSLDQPHTYTYIRDFARGLITLAENEAAFGRAWHVPSAPTLTTRQFVQLLETELGRPVRVRTAGKLMVNLLGLFNPTVREMKEMLYEFEAPFVVEHGRFEAAFGSRTTPHAVALRETLAWYRTHAA